MGQIPHIAGLMSGLKTDLCSLIRDELDPMDDLYELIDKSITEDPPVTIKEGGIIRDGYSQEVDNYRKAFTKESSG